MLPLAGLETSLRENLGGGLLSYPSLPRGFDTAPPGGGSCGSDWGHLAVTVERELLC